MRRFVRFFVVAAVLALPALGCSLFSQSPNAGVACTQDSECFQGQGEACHREMKICCVGCLPDAAPDAAVDGGPDGGDGGDGDAADAGPDGGIDASAIDGAIDAA